MCGCETYIMAAQRRGDGIFVICVGRQTRRLWTATVIRTPAHTNTNEAVIGYGCAGLLELSPTGFPRTHRLPFVQKELLASKVNHLRVMTSKFPV